jgi:hypothetical protein
MAFILSVRFNRLTNRGTYAFGSNVKRKINLKRRDNGRGIRSAPSVAPKFTSDVPNATAGTVSMGIDR